VDIKIRIGKTRIVITIGPYAFKVIRIRFFDFTYKLIKLHYDKIKFGDIVAYKTLRRHSRILLFKDMFIACLLANYREYQYWNSATIKKEDYVPTLFTLLYIINVQERDDVADINTKLIAPAHNRCCGRTKLSDELKYLDNISKTGRILDYGNKRVTS
jgi:hypothetical protein